MDYKQEYIDLLNCDVTLTEEERQTILESSLKADYKRLRQMHYPIIAEQLDMIGKGLVTEMQTMLSEVKAKFVKPTQYDIDLVKSYNQSLKFVEKSAFVKDWVTEEPPKVIIVGSAPSLIGKGLGKLIDSYDIVCRVNWHSGTNVEDYGSRCDILLSNARANALQYIKDIDDSREQQGIVDEVWLMSPNKYTYKYLSKRWSTKNLKAANIDNKFSGGVRGIMAIVKKFGCCDIGGIVEPDKDILEKTHFYDTDGVTHETDVYDGQGLFIEEYKKANKIKLVLEEISLGE